VVFFVGFRRVAFRRTPFFRAGFFVVVLRLVFLAMISSCQRGRWVTPSYRGRLLLRAFATADPICEAK
jgi:hypothetical protein